MEPQKYIQRVEISLKSGQTLAIDVGSDGHSLNPQVKLLLDAFTRKTNEHYIVFEGARLFAVKVLEIAAIAVTPLTLVPRPKEVSAQATQTVNPTQKSTAKRTPKKSSLKKEGN